ncbi:DUF1351 domain-containing protein [Lactobacillus taiwanensis]|uniref:DUF1351 domain-containing protein n=2 Tax=Lactobacillus taiwanensis TaxID=508451 RepID=UPI00242D22B7|nr:DUF1351 domain-containing protein [Lactobacillus taiwanensis]
MTKDLIRFENEDFPISFKPAEVDFPGYQDLKAKVDELAKGWDTYVVTSKSYPYDKKTKAELNRIRKALNDRRKEITKQASQPIDEFTALIKGLDLEIKEAVDHINEGIKAFDEKARKDKHQQNLIRLGEIATEYGVALQKLEYNPKWDNKSTSWKTIEEEARQQFEAIVEQEKARKEAEQVIANKANEYTKPAMTASPYLQMLDYKPLPDVLTQMDNDHKYLIEQAKQQEENRKKAVQDLEKHGDKYIDAKTGEVVDKLHTVTLRLRGTKEQMTALSNFIKDWGIDYERVD